MGRRDPESGATIGAMTTKERLHRLVDELSEAEAAATFEYAVSRREHRDEWGELDAFGSALMGDALRGLDAEERAELGETIGEASARERSK